MDMDILELIGRKKNLFTEDLAKHEQDLSERVAAGRFLVIGGAGSIGQAVAKEIFKRNPRKLHVVDLSENNLVELVRDIRSSFGYIDGDFKTFALDIGSAEYDAFITHDGQYDYVLNLSALKHVRSEKDPFTLMRMIRTNILNTLKTLNQTVGIGGRKYFAVSTDKAANPVNMMGGSKRIMEMFLFRNELSVPVSTARFANVAFSDGSLLHGFNHRLLKQQPIVAPNDVRRYFVTGEESGLLCLFSCLLGRNKDIFFPKLDGNLNLITFSDIAERYLRNRGLEPYLCASEDEARASVKELSVKGRWPCYFSDSDTTGEKDFEEFFTDNEKVVLDTFCDLGIVKSELQTADNLLDSFQSRIQEMLKKGVWTKAQIIELYIELMPDFIHEEKGKYLDSKM